MQDIFGQVHWRTLLNFDDKKAPEFCNAGAFLLLKIKRALPSLEWFVPALVAVLLLVGESYLT